MLDALVKNLAEKKEFSLDEAFGVIRTQGRSLELTEDRFWNKGYSQTRSTCSLTSGIATSTTRRLMTTTFHRWTTSFPKSELKQVKVENPRTGRKDLMKYHDAERNQLANCMLLSKEENGAGGKWDTLPDEWFAGKSKEYLEKHLIPADPNLWKLDQFEAFIEARKVLIRERFKSLLVPETSVKAANAGAL